MTAFHEYLAKRDGISLEEAARRSLGRVWQMAEGDHPMALITAFRGENPLALNMARNESLAQDLRQAGFGFIPVVGGTIENVRDPVTGKETGDKRRVEEQTFLVSAPSMADQAFYRQILRLVKRYDQEAAIVKYKDGKHAFLIARDGAQTDIGVWHKDRLSQFYTRMRYGADAANRSFAFEHAGDTSLFAKMAVHYGSLAGGDV